VSAGSFKSTAHKHTLVIQDPHVVYAAHNGLWHCDICGISPTSGVMRHCSTCPSFDMCEQCYTTTSTLSPLHPHELVQANPKVIYSEYRTWFCNICNKSPGGVMMHCNTCRSFDVCEGCFNLPLAKSPTHNHVLVKSNVRMVYGNTHWECDKCSNQGVAMYHCYYCRDYDQCFNCAVGENEETHTATHPHPLTEALSITVYPAHNGAWFCDVCNKSHQRDKEKMYHCYTCNNFDMCVTCVKR
jgi:hypothetical protein